MINTIWKVATFGESHGAGVGCVIDGVPPRLSLSSADVQRQLDRRRPGARPLQSARREQDRVEIVSGVEVDNKRKHNQCDSALTFTLLHCPFPLCSHVHSAPLKLRSPRVAALHLRVRVCCVWGVGLLADLSANLACRLE